MFYKGDFIYLYTVDFASELNGFVFSCLNNSLEGDGGHGVPEPG